MAKPPAKPVVRILNVYPIFVIPAPGQKKERKQVVLRVDDNPPIIRVTPDNEVSDQWILQIARDYLRNKGAPEPREVEIQR